MDNVTYPLYACPSYYRDHNVVINGLDVDVDANWATTIGKHIRCLVDSSVCTGGKILVPTKTWSKCLVH